ncbi:hypothetical protein C1H76_9560 [Elsinoe australis]|uniref:SCP domain-containing protein n=1 Tax=Elsinoe australis TaxID=40998 RepID=A0A4V6DU58_9PEZI|nr:hypothetical protein C1H76_9560 [Elsinoe australis]
MRSAIIKTLLLASSVGALPFNADSSDSNAVDVQVFAQASVGIPILLDHQDDGQTFVVNGGADVDAEADASHEDEGDSDDSDDNGLDKRAEEGIAQTYRRAAINHHNYHRANHSAAAVTWSVDMANRAKKIANTCVYAHKMDQDGGGYGQNIAVGLPGPNISTVISDLFYNGEINAYGKQYGSEPNMNNLGGWGHMSQIVWKGTKQIGCATVDCRKRGLKNWPANNGYFTVCNYSPPGNYIGEFAEQVGAPLKRNTIRGPYKLNRTAIASGPWPGKNLK